MSLASIVASPCCSPAHIFAPALRKFSCEDSLTSSFMPTHTRRLWTGYASTMSARTGLHCRTFLS
eukprot:SAG31_NODE_242_length_19350_cov_3.043998_2_plen_65_part_00